MRELFQNEEYLKTSVCRVQNMKSVCFGKHCIHTILENEYVQMTRKTYVGNRCFFTRDVRIIFVRDLSLFSYAHFYYAYDFPVRYR